MQAGFLTNLNIKIDLLLILLVFFAVYRDTSEAILCSFFIGFAADLTGQTVIGPHIISFCLFGTALAYLHRVIAVRTVLYQAITIIIMGILINITTGLLNSFKAELVSAGLSLSAVIKISLYSGIAGPFLFRPVGWWMKIKTYRYRRY